MLLRVLILIGFVIATVMAHEIRPALLDLRENAPGDFSVLWKLPVPGGAPVAGEELPHLETGPLAPAGSSEILTLSCGCSFPLSALARGAPLIHPQLPPHAKTVFFPRVPSEESLPGARVKRWSISTSGQGLVGSDIVVHGLQATMLDVLVRIEFLDGHTVTHLLRPSAPSFVVPGPEGGGAPVATYGLLGVEHILLGIDHLLFVLCLLLLVRGIGPLVKTITAFTLAHSITLGLATLGYVHIPIAPVEAVIALSILFLACEVVKLQRGLPGLTSRHPWMVAFTFGLLHGFGFAGALSEVGLPAGDIPLALLLFNLGIEAGQLLFVAAVLMVMALLRTFITTSPPWLRAAPVYLIGGTAAYWFIARAAVLG
jgi:hypothetical protein